MNNQAQPPQAKMVLYFARRLRLLEMTFVRITVAGCYMLSIGVALMIWAAPVSCLLGKIATDFRFI